MGLFKNLFKKNVPPAAKPQTGRSQDFPTDRNTVQGCFAHHYTVIAALLKNSEYRKAPVLGDLFAAMIFILDYLRSYYDLRIDDEMDEVINWFLSIFPSASGLIASRLEFYAEHAESGRIRGEFLLDDIPPIKRRWPPYRCGVVFCDCVYNPECRTDYDHAPALLEGIFSHADKAPLFTAILDQFSAYEKELKSFLL